MKSFKVELRDVTKVFASETGNVIALQNLSLQVVEDEILCVVGPSGCGKTTMLNLIAGFIDPSDGSIVIQQQSDHQRKRCGVVFQQDSVFPWMTIAENVGYSLLFNGPDTSKSKQIIDKYLNLVGLNEFAGNWPRELSGGMRKRVDLARAYAANADILLLDEPFGSLDMLTKEEMQLLLLKIWQRENKTIVFVTHDVEEALFVGHRVAVMTPRPGRIKRVFDVPFSTEVIGGRTPGAADRYAGDHGLALAAPIAGRGTSRNPSLKLTSDFLDIRRQIVAEMSGAD